MNDGSALRKAAMDGDAEHVASVLTQGVPLDATCSNGWTAVMLAAFYDRADTVAFLAERGADVNLKNKAGHTALHYAIKKHAMSALEALLKSGADPNIAFVKEYFVMGETVTDLTPVVEVIYPLIQAILEQDKIAIDLLLKCPSVNVNVSNELGNTPLMFASYVGDTETMRALIDLGANINARSNVGGTPLVVAICAKKFTAARVLLESGADPELYEYDGISPYGYALKYRQKRLADHIESLIKDRRTMS